MGKHASFSEILSVMDFTVKVKALLQCCFLFVYHFSCAQNEQGHASSVWTGAEPSGLELFFSLVGCEKSSKTSVPINFHCIQSASGYTLPVVWPCHCLRRTSYCLSNKFKSESWQHKRSHPQCCQLDGQCHHCHVDAKCTRTCADYQNHFFLCIFLFVCLHRKCNKICVHTIFFIAMATVPYCMAWNKIYEIFVSFSVYTMQSANPVWIGNIQRYIRAFASETTWCGVCALGFIGCNRCMRVCNFYFQIINLFVTNTF